jgi:hypothetical protein
MIDPQTGERRRRAARWGELPADAHALLDRMIEARLLVRDLRRLDSADDEAVVIEVTHEALLRQWPPLVTWLDTDADALKALDAARRAASEWHRNACADGWLTHSGERLVAAERLRKRNDFDRLLGTDGAQYLEACRRCDDAVRKEREGQIERVARAQRWAALLLAAVALVLVVAGARTVAQSREVSRQTALALAIEAERANESRFRGDNAEPATRHFGRGGDGVRRRRRSRQISAYEDSALRGERPGRPHYLEPA